MRGVIFILVWVLSFSKVNAQEVEKERAEINSIISQFGRWISNKDSVSFLRLFTPNSVQWIGVVKNDTPQNVKGNGTLNNYFFNDYAVFYKFLGDKGKQEEVLRILSSLMMTLSVVLPSTNSIGMMVRLLIGEKNTGR